MVDNTETLAVVGGRGGNGEKGRRRWEWKRWREIGRDEGREGARDGMVGRVGGRVRPNQNHPS